VLALAALAAPPAILAPLPGEVPNLSGTPEVRSRLAAPTPAALAAAPGDRLALNLFDDFAPEGVVDSVHWDHGFSVISGHLPGEPDGSFLLVASDQVLTGEVRSPSRGGFEVRPFPGGTLARQLDEARFAPCATGPEHEVSGTPKGAHAAAHGPHADAGDYSDRGPNQIRVLVAYTPQARDAEGGEAQIQARAVFAINQANTAYVNSQAAASLTLAWVGLVDYVESTNPSTELSRFRSTTDGFMDSVHCIRNQVAADMCALLVGSMSGACGIGYLQTNPGPGFATSAFTVTDKDCISGYTFAHELGHNMGCAHDRANASSAAYSYAYGYRTPDNVYRTIMAYSPGSRIGRFSNPNITYNGYVMGIPLTDPSPAYNALCISNTAPIIAQFRTGNGVSIDFNADGNTDQDDIACLIATIAGNGACSSADPDLNADGNADQDDVLHLINLIAGGGCP
jgi:peptidyl-Asp metalloendopeptidase